MHSPQKLSNVPLEEALRIAGPGMYTTYVTISMGMIYFSSLLSLQGMAIVMPAAGCDLQLDNGQRGTLNSIAFTGMLFSAQIFGFLADTFGRKRTIQICQLANIFTIVAWCLAPDFISLAVVLFLNGFIVTGSLTPSYVAVSEFCPADTRARALVIQNGIGAMANMYLPGLAWLVTPLDIHIPIYGNLVLSSWRLFILLQLIPVCLSLMFLWKLPETPKFLLSQGKKEETLEVLQLIFSVNQGKKKEEYPVTSVCLDSIEEESTAVKSCNNQFLYYIKMMLNQILVLFSKQYFLFTLISCVMLLGEGGMYNTLILWFPEITTRIINYSSSHEVFNVSLCDLMTRANAIKTENCGLNFDSLTASFIIGSSQVILSFAIGFFAPRIRRRKLILGVTMLSCASLMVLAIYLPSQYFIIAALSITTVILYLMFPVVVSIIVDLFPTPLRSTATSISMLCARLGSAAGSQIMGLLYENYCRLGYFGISFTLIVTGMLGILMPRRKK